MREKLEYNKYQLLRDNIRVKVNRVSNIRMILFIVMLVSFILKYYYYPFGFQMLFVVSLVLFVVMVIVYDKYFKVYDYYVKYIEIIETYLDRENGNWKTFRDNGEEFLTDKKPYLSDLDILGNCSLFQYLSVCRTLGGRECLVKRLSNVDLDEEELISNQEAILELSKKITFGIKFQVAMKYYEGKKIHLNNEFSYLDKTGESRKIDLVIGIIASIICIGLFLLAFLEVISFSYFYGMFFFNLMISYLYGIIFKEEFLNLDKTILTYGKLEDVFEVFLNEKFNSGKLNDIQRKLHEGYADILFLHQMDSMNSLKNNLLASIFCNGLGCFNLFLLYRFFNFLNRNLSNLMMSIQCIEEVEALISLATLGIVRDEYCIPSCQKKVALKFVQIKHPLLDEKNCVGNDFESGNGVHIITGSNMGGKTSFLRAIGINLILMQAGGFVCARSFSASYFKIFTSMRIVDDINKGISTFYGELFRIGEMVEYVDQGNMLVLVDEIFKGTNYHDRMYGAKEVIEKLNTKKTIAFITTHDFELCDEERVHNYHVKEDYEGEKIIFDYKIRAGKCKSTNAKYLMKRLGIIK